MQELLHFVSRTYIRQTLIAGNIPVSLLLSVTLSGAIHPSAEILSGTLFGV